MAYEIDKKGNILRRIERFSSGYFKYDGLSDDDVSLSDIEFDMSWIDASDPEFTVVFLNQEEFERLVEIARNRN